MTAILGAPEIGWPQASAWAASRGAPAYWCELAELAWAVAAPVRPEVVWAQACKETGFGKFLRPDGTPSPATNRGMRNPCGLKPTGGADNDEPHATFPDWPAGFAAQRDHLALYAGAAGYPRTQTHDPRHFTYLLGDAPTVEALSMRWAGAGYGESIVRDYLAPLLGFHG